MSTETRNSGRPLSARLRLPALTGLAGALLVFLLLGIVLLLGERLGGPRSTAAPGPDGPPPAVGAAPTPAPIVISSAVGFGTPIVIGSAPSAPAAAPPTATAPPAAARRLVVAHTSGDGVNLRREPAISGAVIVLLPEGTRLEQTGAERQADGRRWYPVRDGRGNQGWVAASFTQPAP